MYALLKRALRSLHSRILDGFHGPWPRDVLRDLGVDNTAGRLRRLGTFKKRTAKAVKRAGKLRQLPKGVRTTLVQTNCLGIWSFGCTRQWDSSLCVEELPEPGGVQICCSIRFGPNTAIGTMLVGPLLACGACSKTCAGRLQKLMTGELPLIMRGFTLTLRLVFRVTALLQEAQGLQAHSTKLKASL